MADEQALEMLLQGSYDWNRWRRGIISDKDPDLSGADLSEEDLSEANLSEVDLSNANLAKADLSRADLSDANLSRADLSRASLYEADLSRARLSRADLSKASSPMASFKYADLSDARLFGADLSGADFSGADLSGADLSRSSLSGTNLSGTDLSGANLSSAYLSGTQFGGATFDSTLLSSLDLREAEDLELVKHNGPSDISISTIYSSEGNIPELFLDGCGVHETFGVQIPALVAAMQPIQFYSCFISYSSKDDGLAQRLHADLRSKGVRCWFAPEDLKIGERFRRRIDEVIRVHDKLLLILSKHSVASSWVEKEVETAMESEGERKRTILFPVRLDNSVMEIKAGWPADVRRTRHIGDFRRWKEHDEYQKAFARLLADLKASA